MESHENRGSGKQLHMRFGIAEFTGMRKNDFDAEVKKHLTETIELIKNCGRRNSNGSVTGDHQTSFELCLPESLLK